MVTLEPAADSPMNLRVTQSTDPSGGSGRFTYAGGSQPLAGYTIKRGVGHGGFGEVYYAVSDAGKEVALKLIRRNLDIELRGVTQCLNLKHPNLVSLFDIRQGEHDESWVIMEYVKGPSLEQVLAEHPNGLAWDEAMAWIQGIAAGVAYLHDHGIVHRDLKPGNLFREDGIVKIGDYGLSKFISCSRRSGQTGSVGTVHYMAPEVANGRYGKEIDIYAVGIMLFEMLTGKAPFDGESMGEVLMKHLTAQPDLTPVPEPFRKAISAALVKDPEARLHSVSQLVALLPPVAPALPSMAGIGAAPVQPQLAAAAATAGAAAGMPVAPAAKSPSSSPLPDEPIARFVVENWRRGRDWWLHSTGLAPWQRTMVSLIAIIGLLSTVGLWGMPVVAITIVYGVYRLIRAIVMPPKPRPSTAGVPVAPAAAYPVSGSPSPPPSSKAQQWRHANRRTLAGPWLNQVRLYQPRTGRERWTELVGSMVLAAIVALVTSLALVAIRGAADKHVGGRDVFEAVRSAPIEPNQLAWLAITSTLGAWFVLIPAAAWEGKREEASIRRFIMLIAGLALGAAAYFTATHLMVDLPHEATRGVPGLVRGYDLYDAEGAPTVLNFMATFGLAMFIPTWWRQVDRTRRARFSFWKVIMPVVWAYAVNLFLPFPQPWGFMVVGAISIAAQMASPLAPTTTASRT